MRSKITMSTSDAQQQSHVAHSSLASSHDPGRLNLLVDVLLRIAANNDRELLVTEFASQLSWVLDFQQCWFGLMEQDGGISYHQSGAHFNAPANISPFDQKIMAQVMCERRPQRVENDTDQVVLCLPLCLGDRAIGAVLLRSPHPSSFDRSKIRYSQAAAAFLALALDRLGRIEALAKAKEALEQSNMELQQFAYIASHDLQTPLRGIAGFAQFLG